jgi:hypothetical protein
MMDEEKIIDFLRTAISDAQEGIRFLENKVAFCITVLASIIIGIISIIEHFPEYIFSNNEYLWTILSTTFILIIVCIWITVRIIRPTINPQKNIIISNENNTSIPFYLAPNVYPRNEGIGYIFWNSANFKLAQKGDAYLKGLLQAQNIEIIKSLTLELLKVSFIRNIKNDRFHQLVPFLLYTTFSFFLFTIYIFYISYHNK